LGAPAGATDPGPATALLAQKRVLSYPFDAVWPSAIRYLRIDRGYTIAERDAEAGFILFSFPVTPDRTGSGSLEVLRTVDAAGRPSVELRAATSAGPSHLPHTLLDGIAAKVRAERGQPAPPPPPGGGPPDTRPDAPPVEDPAPPPEPAPPAGDPPA
jgi:hypothetical protein